MAETDNPALENPPFHEILTERLRLRTLRVEDAKALMPLVTCDEVMKWTSHGIVLNLAQAERWIHTRAVGAAVFNFAIELREDESKDTSQRPIVGLAGSFHVGEIGYMIRPDYAGQGYATEAITAIIPQLFERIPPLSEGGTGLDHIEGCTDVTNRPSQRILEKVGFTHCETVLDPDNGPSEVMIYRKARPGKTLEELGLSLASKDGDSNSAAPTPPVQ